MKFFKKWLPLLIILCGMLIIYFFHLYRYFDINKLQLHHHALKLWVEAHPFSAPILFIGVYILSTAFSVPGGAILSIIGGFLFPQPLCTIYVVVGATIGATLLFLAAKTALGDLLKQKASPFLKRLESGFKKNQVSYLLFLRFVPLFPFWLVNLAPAFFSVPLKTYLWTTAVGIIPGAFVYTQAGRGLEAILDQPEPLSIQGLFNPQVRWALILLGVFSLVPILIKRLRRKHD